MMHTFFINHRFFVVCLQHLFLITINLKRCIPFLLTPHPLGCNIDDVYSNWYRQHRCQYSQISSTLYKTFQYCPEYLLVIDSIFLGEINHRTQVFRFHFIQ